MFCNIGKQRKISIFFQVSFVLIYCLSVFAWVCVLLFFLSYNYVSCMLILIFSHCSYAWPAVNSYRSKTGKHPLCFFRACYVTWKQGIYIHYFVHCTTEIELQKEVSYRFHHVHISLACFQYSSVLTACCIIFLNVYTLKFRMDRFQGSFQNQVTSSWSTSVAQHMITRIVATLSLLGTTALLRLF
jgi:hypothetical protein